MYAVTSSENRTNDRFFIEPRPVWPKGPGAEATWRELDGFLSPASRSDNRAKTRSIALRLAIALPASLFAGTASMLLVQALAGTQAQRVLAALMFSSGWLYLGLATVSGRRFTACGNLIVAGTLFAAAFAGLNTSGLLLAGGIAIATGWSICLGALKSIRK